MIIIFDIVFFAYGVYTVYAAISMKKNQRLTRFFTGRESDASAVSANNLGARSFFKSFSCAAHCFHS